MKYLLNNDTAHLMVWPTNPNKRKGDLKINYNEYKNNPVQVGDTILGMLGSVSQSAWVVKEIIEKRDSSISGMNYVQAICEFKNASLSSIDTKLIVGKQYLINQIDNRKQELLKTA